MSAGAALEKAHGLLLVATTELAVMLIKRKADRGILNTAIAGIEEAGQLLKEVSGGKVQKEAD